MESKEIEGKTIDQAIEAACRYFDVPRGKLNIEILSEGSSGFLGIGAKKARIRAALLSLDMALDDAFEKPIRLEDKSQQIFRLAEINPVTPAPKASVASTEQNADVAATAQKAGDLLGGILKHMGFNLPFTWEEKGGAIVFRITGGDTEDLIGKGGQTLDAIQYILNKAVIPGGSGKKKIVLDTDEYRVKREQYLVALATRLAEKVKRTHKPVSVDNLNAHDRRIIHLALQGDAALMTKSRGEGAFRKIIIMPAKKSDTAKPRNNQA